MRPDKVPDICRSLRERVISGSFAPGARLPSQTELIKEFSASNVTIQNAMKTLARQGYVEPRGPLGTFVAEVPPFLRRIVMLSPRAEEGDPNTFFNTFARVGEELAPGLGIELEVIWGYEGWRRGFEDYQRLVDEMETGMLAGIIFSANPYLLRETPLLDYPGVPRVAFMQDDNVPGLSSVWVDYKQLLSKSFEFLGQSGCKRLAMILPEVDPEIYFKLSALELCGLESPPELIQMVPYTAPKWCENVVRLMMSLPDGKRPDCLFIGNDNLVWHTTKALQDLNVRIPEDIRVVGHANLPCASESVMPIARIGFDLEECFRHCVRTIVALREGRSVAAHRILPALFEGE